MRSDAASVKDYLKELPDDRRKALERVRKTIRASLPDGYEEAMNWGMITYQVPLATYPDTYNGQPLLYAGLVSQKNHMALYLSAMYQDPKALEAFQSSYEATGKKLDMGKSCVRFKTLDDLPLELIGETIASVNADEFVQVQKTFRTSR